jgi:hypothetical protein
VAGFQPSAADLDYPGKLLRLAQAPPPDGAAAAAGREGTDAAQQPDERAPLVQDGGASEDAQVGTWRPPLRCAAGACRARQHIRGQVRLTMRGERPYVKALVRSAARVRLSARRRSASGPPVAAVPQEGASPDRRARARAARERAGRARGLVPAGAAHAGLPVAAVPLRGAPRVRRARAGCGGLLRRRRAGARAGTPALGLPDITAAPDSPHAVRVPVCGTCKTAYPSCHALYKPRCICHILPQKRAPEVMPFSAGRNTIPCRWRACPPWTSLGAQACRAAPLLRSALQPSHASLPGGHQHAWQTLAMDARHWPC